MPLQDPRAIANHMLIIANGRALTQRQIHSLLFVAHGWTLAIDGEPLVSGHVSAADRGPSFLAIRQHFGKFGIEAATTLLRPRRGPAFAAPISETEEKILAKTWQRYGKSLTSMIGITHAEGTPWSNTYFGHRRGGIIPESEIKSFFTRLAIAGRQPDQSAA